MRTNSPRLSIPTGSRPSALTAAVIGLSALMILAMPAIPASAAPTARTVCPAAGPGCDHTSIQEAVDVSSPGDTILVRAGAYRENVDVDVADLTICAASGSGCSDAEVLVQADAGPQTPLGLLTLRAPALRISGLILDPSDVDGLASVSVGAADIVLRDNVLVGDLGFAPGLQGTTVDARLNDWHSYAWRVLGDKITDPAGSNRALQFPFRLADGSIEPPLPVVVGSAGHSGVAANCDNWDADGDGFADSFFFDGACFFITVQSAIDFSHPGTALSPQTLVLPASANLVDPTPRFEALHIDVNNQGGTLLGGGTIPGPAQELDHFVLCAGVNTPSQAEPPTPEPGATCATGTDAVLARHGVIIEAGNPIILGNGPSGSRAIDIGAVADNVTLQNLTIQWSGDPDTDFGASDVIGVEVSGADATIEGNFIRMQGGGCTPEDFGTGGCYSPARTFGIRVAGSAPGLGVTQNLIRADLPHPSNGTIGGTDGFRGGAPGGVIEMNLFAGWARHGVVTESNGMTVASNAFAANAEALAICASNAGDPVVADGNVFVGNITGIDLLNGCGGSENLAIENNGLGLTNGTALHVLNAAGLGTVPAECNDWGVYEASLIPNRITDDRAGGLDVDFEPFRSPTATTGPLDCLLAPFARFGTDLSAENSENQINTPDTTRYHEIEFTDLSDEGSKPIVSWLWSFGSEGMSTEQNPTFTFPTTGLKTVDLLVRDADGMTSLASFTINITDCSTDGGLAVVKVLPGVSTFCSIQDAVDAAPNGATVVVPPDTYHENISIPDTTTGLTLCKGVAACNDGAAETTISAVDPLGYTIVSRGANTTIRGFTIENPTLAGSTGAVEIRGSGTTLTGNDLAGNFQPQEYLSTAVPDQRGAVVRSVATGIVVSNNDVHNWYRGMYITTASGVVTNNQIHQNRAQGILIESGHPLRIERNTFAEHGENALRINPTVPMGVTANLKIRENVFELTSPAVISVGSSAAPGAVIDARLNDWKVYDHTQLGNRNQANGRTILQLPFLLANGTAEPPLPSSAPASHSGTPATCNAHDADGDGATDAEFVDGVCRFLNVQAAIDFGHAGGKVTVPMSQSSSPTPWFETLQIASNNDAVPEVLNGLTACATVAVGQCEPVSEPARFGIFSAATWGTPPVAHQGQAIRMQGTGSTSLFTRTFDNTGAPLVSDLTGLSFDFFKQSGSCPAGTPRMTLRLDTTGDGLVDSAADVYPSGFTCPGGTWINVDLMTSTNWGAIPGMSHAAFAAANPTARIISMNLIIDSGGPGDVFWIDNQRYQNSFFREASDACDGDSRSPLCAREVAQAGTILDGTGLGATGVDIDAPNVKLQGFTLRRTAPPDGQDVQAVDITGATGAEVSGNAIKMQGGGCTLTGCGGGFKSVGVLSNGTAGAKILNNTISGSPASSDQSAGGTTGIKATLTGASLIEGNTIRKWAVRGAQISGADAVLQRNTFEGNRDGLEVCAINARALFNTFKGHRAAVVACNPGTGLLMRDNNMDLGNSFAVLFPAGVTGKTVDARLNYWGVTDARLLPLRVLDENPAMPPSGNKVLQTPFRSTPS